MRAASERAMKLKVCMINHPLVAMGVQYSLGGVRYSLVNNVCGVRYSLGYRIHSDNGTNTVTV